MTRRIAWALGAVVAVGKPPSASTDGTAGGRVRAAAARIWPAGGGSGKAAVVGDLAAVAPHLRGLDLDDIRLSPPSPAVLHVHRVLGGKDIHFFACTAPPGFDGSAWLRGAAG
ncbi:MAG TPA: hypothetical protein PLI70_08620, partial [Gemmatimonadales bacterium]|nr:hypothetical protein [Gemmatimonadales bacterium]